MASLSTPYICQKCNIEFATKYILNTHNKAMHSDTTTFNCSLCTLTFKHKSSLRRHLKSGHTTTTNKRRNLGDDDLKMHPQYKVPKSNTTLNTKKKIIFQQYQQLQDLLNSSDDSFDTWAKTYQEKRGVDDPSLSESTVKNIISTYNNHFKNLHLTWHDPMCICEQIDQWLDNRFEDSTLQPITTVNHLRHLRWWAMYEFTFRRTTGIVLDWLFETIASIQAASSKRNNDAPCIAMLDPYQLAQLRDRVVTALQKQQRDVIDPFLLKVCQAPTPLSFRKDCVEFGIQHLRCFLDLCMRFLCPPQRMQCTIYQCEPDITNTQYVCKLSRRNNEYVRIIHRDKTGNTHQPLEVPLGITLSVYLTFYRAYCRPDPTRHNTFQTNGGGYWIHASRDVKHYVKEHLHIDPNEIEPNGRFVHGTRHIGLATYALAVQFNSERLREFAHLIRHSVAVSEKYYSVWLERNRNERASKHFCETMGLEKADSRNLDSVIIYKPLSIRPPQPLVRSKMIRKLQEELGKSMFLESPYELRDASTQTGPDHDDTKHPTLLLSDSCTLPICSSCQGSFMILGPLGRSRHVRFGCYYAQCVKCHGRRPHKQTVVWYPLGYHPSGPTLSQKPRNLETIRLFVSTNTT